MALLTSGRGPAAAHHERASGKVASHRRRPVVARAPSIVCTAVAAPQRDVPSTSAAEQGSSDFVLMLREYRRLQSRLGQAAAREARVLSGSWSWDQSWDQRHEAIRSAASRAGCPLSDFTELVQLRRRLLHDLPYVRAQLVADTRGEKHPQHQAEHRSSSGGEASSGALAATQWAHAKQYKQRHSHKTTHASGGSASSSQPASSGSEGTGASPGRSWISRLGFSDMVRDSDLQSGAAGSAAAVAVTHGAGQTAGATEQAQDTEHAESSSAPLVLHPPAPITVTAAEPHSQATTQQQQQEQASATATATPAPQAPAATLAAGSARIADAQHPQSPQLPVSQQAAVADLSVAMASTATEQVATVGPGVQVSGVTVVAATGDVGSHQGPETGATEDTEEAELAAAPARLRQALQAALKYKRKKGPDGTAVAGGDDSVQSEQIAVPKEYQGLTVDRTVEKARFDVYAAPRKSRANPEEAALQVCP